MNKTPFVSLSGDILTYSVNDISAMNEETILFYVSGQFPISIFMARKDLFKSYCLF